MEFLALFLFYIGSILGLAILQKYYEYHKKDFLYFSISAFLIVAPWWPSATSFIVALFNNGIGIPAQLYFILGNTPVPFTCFFWLLVFTDLAYPDKEKIIKRLWILFIIAFEVILYTLLIFNPSYIGSYDPEVNPVNVDYGIIMTFLLGFVVLITLITGCIFGIESLKSEDHNLRLKGIFLLVGFTLYSIGAILDISFPLSTITLIIARTILISCSVSFYIGILGPNWAKKLFLKKNAN